MLSEILTALAGEIPRICASRSGSFSRTEKDVYKRQEKELQTENKYQILYLRSGSLSLSLNDIKLSLAAPCVLLLNERDKSFDFKPHAMKAEVISFHVNFLNKNITYDLINSGDYERNLELYGFIPLKMFYDRSEGYTGILPLSNEVLPSVDEFIAKFKAAVIEQNDYRWSCREMCIRDRFNHLVPVCVVTGHRNRYPGILMVFRFADRKTVDIKSAAGEHAGNSCENTKLVGHQHGNDKFFHILPSFLI